MFADFPEFRFITFYRSNDTEENLQGKRRGNKRVTNY